MQEPSLNDFGISNEQYAVYEKYKQKIEERNQQINKFGEKFDTITGWILPLCIFIVIAFMFILNSEGFDNVVLLFESRAYGKIILLIFSLVLVSIPLFLMFRLLLWFIPEYILIDLLKLDKLCKKLYAASLPAIPRAAYFDVIEEYDKKKQMYEAHKLSLEKEYPEIELFGHDKGLYFEHILNQISVFEKEYVNKMTALQNNRNQREYWLSLSGREFEKEIAWMYNQLGYKVELTPTTGDGGIDIKLWKNGIFSVIQCKNHRQRVSVDVVRDLFGTMNKVGATSGILICSGGFTRGVFDFVRGLPIQLIDIDNLFQIVNELIPQQIETVADISDKKFRAKDREFFNKLYN